MAKVKGPLFSINAMGTVGEKLIYRKRKRIDDVKKYTKTINPDTSGQKIQKGYFKGAISAWQTDGYTLGDIKAWNLYALTRKVKASGFNMFARYRMIAEKESRTWTKLVNCVISEVSMEGFTVDIDVESDKTGILYIGTSKTSMLTLFDGVFNTDHYTFVVSGLSKLTKYYFYIKSTKENEAARTGIYSQKTTEKPAPIDIDIGGAAIDRTDWMEWTTTTLILPENPANATGKITTVEIWANQSLAGAIVAIFTQVEANVFTARDSQSIGSVTAGSKQTFEVDLNVVEGDFIGLYWTSGRMEWSSTGDGDWYMSGDQTSCVDKTFIFRENKSGSIYGKGKT